MLLFRLSYPTYAILTVLNKFHEIKFFCVVSFFLYLGVLCPNYEIECVIYESFSYRLFTTAEVNIV